MICGDRVALASPNEVGNLVAAGERIEERINVVAALTARRDLIRNQPGRRAEAEAIEVAIAKRLDGKLEGVPVSVSGGRCGGPHPACRVVGDSGVVSSGPAGAVAR